MNIEITNIVNVSEGTPVRNHANAIVAGVGCLGAMAALTVAGVGVAMLAGQVYELLFDVAQGAASAVGALASSALGLVHGIAWLAVTYGPTALWAFGYTALGLIVLAFLDALLDAIRNRPVVTERKVIIVVADRGQLGTVAGLLPDSTSYEVIETPVQKAVQHG